jgi:hypothetical protein
MSEILRLHSADNWQSIHTGSFVGPNMPLNPNLPLSISFPANYRILSINISSDIAPAKWWLGGILDVAIDIEQFPNTSFVGFTEVCSRKLRINCKNLVKLPQWIADTAPYICFVRPPRWMTSGFIEAYEYIGPDQNSTEVRLADIQDKLAEINAKIP